MTNGKIVSKKCASKGHYEFAADSAAVQQLEPERRHFNYFLMEIISFRDLNSDQSKNIRFTLSAILRGGNAYHKMVVIIMSMAQCNKIKEK